MTIIEAIQTVDELCPNTYAQLTKIKWLSDLDGMIKKQIFDTHVSEETEYVGYDESTPLNTELLAPDPFTSIYPLWLQTRIEFSNKEYADYNNSVMEFNNSFAAFRNDYNRTHDARVSKINYFSRKHERKEYDPLET